MASILRIKRSETSGNPAVLAAGELAYSALLDNGSNGGDRLYIGMGTETNDNAVNHIIIGGKRYTDMVDAATSVGTNNTLVKRDGANTAYLNIIGNVTGSVTGGISGDVTGNLTGNVTGNVTGNITSTGASSFTNATVTGGSINGTAIGATTASTVTGTTITATTGFVGNVTGNLTGDVFASNGTSKILDNGTDGTNAVFTGALTGNVTGNVTGNLTGNVTGNADTATSWLNSRNLSLTGDGTATLASVNGAANVSAALTLATVNSNVGSFGSATAIPIVTVNGKGLVTAVSTANIATTLNVAGSAGAAGSLSLLTDTLNFTTGSGLKTTFDDTTNSLLIEMDGAAQLSSLTLTGALAANALTITTSLSAGNTTVNDISVNGNAIITGNLTVNGTMTAVNSTTVTINDKNLQLAQGANTAILSDGGGITVGNTLDGFTAASITYSAIDNRWNLNKDLTVANVYGALIGNASTATTWATARNLSLTGDASGTIASVDGSANVSGALTLATVNSNVGSYGNGTTVPNFTVNAKGLVTAAGSTAIPFASTSVKGLASFDSTQFSITSGAVTLAQIDGGSF
jgi:hypothetical protein